MLWEFSWAFLLFQNGIGEVSATWLAWWGEYINKLYTHPFPPHHPNNLPFSFPECRRRCGYNKSTYPLLGNWVRHRLPVWEEPSSAGIPSHPHRPSRPPRGSGEGGFWEAPLHAFPGTVGGKRKGSKHAYWSEQSEWVWKGSELRVRRRKGGILEGTSHSPTRMWR